MPIKPENRARYPKDWKAIVAQVRERSGDKCEGSPAFPDCRVANGAVGYREGGRWVQLGESADEAGLASDVAMLDGHKVVRIVLTTAHLGLPAYVPVHLAMTRSAEADEVIQIVGLFVPLQAEKPEWENVMHGRLLSEFFRGPKAVPTRFVIALPGGSFGFGPRGTVAQQASTMSPEYAVLSDWRLLSEPFEAAFVSAKAASLANVEPADFVRLMAPLANAVSESALDSAQVFVATGRRTGLPAISSLLRANRENLGAYNARLLRDAFPLWPTDTGALDPKAQATIEDFGTGVGARLARALGVEPERKRADGAGQREWTFPWSCHDGILLAFSEFPENCDTENLRHWCQRCHLVYDGKHHAETAYMTRKAKSNTVDLFAEQIAARL